MHTFWLKNSFAFLNLCVHSMSICFSSLFYYNHIIIYNYFIIEKNHSSLCIEPGVCVYDVLSVHIKFSPWFKRNVQLEALFSHLFHWCDKKRWIKEEKRIKSQTYKHIFSAVFVNAISFAHYMFHAMGCVRCLFFVWVCVNVEFWDS